MTDTGQFFEFLEISGDFAAVFFDQNARKFRDRLRFLRAEPAWPNDFLYLRNLEPSHFFGSRGEGKKLRRRFVDPLIRTSRRQQDRDEQSVGVTMVERDRGIRIKLVETFADEVGAFLSSHCSGNDSIRYLLFSVKDKRWTNKRIGPKLKEMHSPRSERRIFAIGDVHGCARELEALLGKLKLKPDDLVVFLGDYVDRGPDSRRVIDIVLQLSEKVEVVALKGNHEALFLDFLDHPESAGAGLFVLNGGTSTLANYWSPDGKIEIPESHIRFLRELKLYHETDDYFFVHAGVPNIPLKEINPAQYEMVMLWSRQPFLSSQFRWEKLIVHGHTPVREVEILPNRINLDTACVFDGQLTAMEFPSRKLYQVPKGIKNQQMLFPREYQSSRISVRFSGRIPVRAGRPGAEEYEFLTLNYNQFGLLMHPRNENEAVDLEIGDDIEGTIGENPDSMVRFAGSIVRMETRGPSAVYGVKVERVSGEIGGPEWIKRPSIDDSTE